MLENILTLAMLTLLQAVLGFDNLLYISLESKRAPEPRRQYVRRLGIGLAVFLRIALLFVLMRLIESFQKPIVEWSGGIIDGSFNFHALIVLAGGMFIIYTSTREILHMTRLEDEAKEVRSPRTVTSVVTSIVAMNIVFSFDSILSAIALTDVFWVMAVAILLGGIMMIWLADGVSQFLHRNRMYEVLGLFVLFVVGIMLLSEGGHLAHMHLFGHPITAMSKATFYFVIAVLVLTDIVQSRYQKRLLSLKDAH